MKYVSVVDPIITHDDQELNLLTFVIIDDNYLSINGDSQKEDDWILREEATVINEETDLGFLASMRIIKKAEFKNILIQEVSSFFGDYTQIEVDTFGLQYTEILDYTSDNTAITPFITSLADARGITRGALSTEITAMFTDYRNLLTENIGIKQIKFNEIDAATTLTELNTITWEN